MALAAHYPATLPPPQSIIQLLDDHHLVILSDNPGLRDRIGQTLKTHLISTPDSQVIDLDGSCVTSVRSFAVQFEAQLELTSASWTAGSTNGQMQRLIELLRAACSGPKRRYVVWRDAHTMLEADVDLFCRLVNALFCVAAESEHITLDPVMVQRVIFLGGGKLGAYAEDTSGQFCKWLDDGKDGSPFWEIMSMVERPAVITYRVDG
ncbi:MAG: hypothetical protein L0219_09170 [Phycisphaerales bacterium]|nr:hypothetical protein [Phycisphaerales bacterium]